MGSRLFSVSCEAAVFCRVPRKTPLRRAGQAFSSPSCKAKNGFSSMGNNVLSPFRLQRKTDFFYPHGIKFSTRFEGNAKTAAKSPLFSVPYLTRHERKDAFAIPLLKAFVRLRAERKASSAPFLSKEERFNGLSNPV